MTTQGMNQGAGSRPQTSEPSLRVQLLGEPRLELCGRTLLAGGCDKLHLLLYHLALEGPSPRGELAELFWPGLPLPAARNNLRQSLHRLRAFGHEAIPLLAVDGEQIRLNPALNPVVDVHRFIALTQSAELESMALAGELYRGPFLNECLPPAGLEAMEDWVIGWRDHLEVMAQESLRGGLAIARQAGDTVNAQRLAGRLVELEPWDEEAHLVLIRGYLTRGERSAAEAQYRGMADALDRELGVAPSIAMEALLAEGSPPPSSREPAGMAMAPVNTGRERRRVTAVFMELAVGDADPVAAVGELRDKREAILERFLEAGGHPISRFGAGVLIYFGYPLAREDAARLAVETALAAVAECPEVRVAIHNGLVVTGRPGGPVVGETPARTIQLRRHGEPGSVIISAPVYTLVSGYFRFRRLSGEEPVWHVLEATDGRDRLEAHHRPLSPLVGRERELGWLMERLEHLSPGRSELVVIEGEAGIGKSRLLRAMQGRCPDGIVMRHFRCVESAQDSPLWPLLDALRRRSGIDGAASTAERRAQFRHYLEGLGVDEPEPILRTLWPLLDPAAEEGRAEEPERVREIIKELPYYPGRSSPLLFFIEDVHLADSATLGLLEQLALSGEGPDHGLLYVVSTRPPCRLPWVDPESHLRLEPLNGRAAMGLAWSVAGGRLDAEQLDWLVARCDGIPLYLEEAAWMLAAGGEDDVEAAIPSTLQDLLMARIDGLGSWRGLAQRAATLGADFERPLLAAVSEDDPERLENGIDALLEAGILERDEGTAPDHYRFRHALLQEAAYQSQLRQDRTRAHARIAQVTLDDYPEIVERQPEWLAHHLEQSGDRESALLYWCRGAEMALRRSAYREASHHLRRARALLVRQPEGEVRDRAELRLQILTGTLSMEQEGFGSDNAGQAFARALRLCEGLEGVEREEFYALWGWWGGSSSREKTRQSSLDTAKDLHRVATTIGEPAMLARSGYAFANNLFFRGYFQASREQAEAALSQRDSHTDDGFFGEDPYVVSRAFLGWAHWYQGAVSRGQAEVETALSDARKRGRGHDLGMVLTFLATHGFRSRDRSTVARAVEELVPMAEEQGLALWLLSGRVYQGWVRVVDGDPDGLQQIEACVEPVRTAMASVESFFLMVWADALLRLGQSHKLPGLLERAFWLEGRYTDGYDSAEWRRLRGWYWLQGGGESGKVHALDCQRLAREVASQQGAWQLALRAAIDCSEHPGSSTEDGEWLERALHRVEEANGGAIELLSANPDWCRARGRPSPAGFDSRP